MVEPGLRMIQKQVKCPHCGQTTEFSAENPHRPFCSERCQLLDLGDWASEKFSIPAEDQTPSEDKTDEGNSRESDTNEG